MKTILVSLLACAAISPGSAFTDWMETQGISSATADNDQDGLPAINESVTVDQSGVPSGFRRRLFQLPANPVRLFARTVVRLH